MTNRAARRRAQNPRREARSERQAGRASLVRSVVRRERRTGRHLGVDTQDAHNVQLARSSRRSLANRRTRRGAST